MTNQTRKERKTMTNARTTTTSGTTTATNGQSNNNEFTKLLRTYEQAARTRTPQTEQQFATALQELATACTYSVLKKLCNVGGAVTEQTKNTNDTTKTIRTLRQSIAQDTTNIKALHYATNNATAYEYNQDGELKQVIKDKELNKAITKLLDYCFNDGIDLINTAIVTILTETSKATDLTTNFLESPHQVRRLKKKVYIKDVDSLGGYETVTTTAIQEIYKAVRRDIEKSRTMQVASHKYTYIADIFKDTETDTETEVYKRLPKYSGLAYETTDINGKITAITADMETVKDTETIISQMNLTEKQAKVLQLRQSGYGQRAIATYLGVTPQAIQKTLKQIQVKAVAIGLTPTK